MTCELRKGLNRLHYQLNFGKTPSPRHLEEMMQERGVFVDHSKAHRWAMKILPVLALVFRRRKRSTAPRSINENACLSIELRQSKYLNNIVE